MESLVGAMACLTSAITMLGGAVIRGRSWSQKIFDRADFDLMQLRAYVQHYKFATDDEATNPTN